MPGADAAPRAHFTFAMPLRVRWAETDPQGVVFNPHYFAYADVAFTEYMRTIGFRYPQDLHERGCDLYAVRAEGNFRAPARYDDVLELAFRAARIGTASATFDVRIERDGILLFDATLVYVSASLHEHRAVPIPETLLACIAAYERTPATAKEQTGPKEG